MPVTIQLENPCLTAVLDGEIDHHCARINCGWTLKRSHSWTVPESG